MAQAVSITSQGQLTIPKAIRDAFGIHDMVKAFIKKEGNKIVVEPKTDFWSLSGSLESKISLTDKDLKKARQAFSNKWAKNS